MQEEEIIRIVQSIFIDYFSISIIDFSWNLPLEALNEDFGFLSTLLKLENILEKHFQTKIALLEQIDTTFNTPQDIVNLIL